MLNIKFLYKVYIEQVQYKIQTCMSKELEYENTFNYVKNTIINNKDEFEKYGINIDSLLLHPYVSYSKIAYLVDNGQLNKVGHYVKDYASAYRYLNYFKLTRLKLEKSIMPYHAYRDMIFAINREISKYILEGGSYTMGVIGKIFIIEKANIQYADWSMPTGTRVDWAATKANKKKLQEQGISLYNEKLNPTGTKYFKYHNNDFDYWWSWLAGAVHNRSLFRFYPNSYVHNMGRSVDCYVAKAKSIDQILNTTAIGNEDKMRALIKFDSLWYLRYRRPEYEGKRFTKKYQFNRLFLESTIKS